MCHSAVVCVPDRVPRIHPHRKRCTVRRRSHPNTNRCQPNPACLLAHSLPTTLSRFRHATTSHARPHSPRYRPHWHGHSVALRKQRSKNSLQFPKIQVVHSLWPQLLWKWTKYDRVWSKQERVSFVSFLVKEKTASNCITTVWCSQWDAGGKCWLTSWPYSSVGTYCECVLKRSSLSTGALLCATIWCIL